MQPSQDGWTNWWEKLAYLILLLEDEVALTSSALGTPPQASSSCQLLRRLLGMQKFQEKRCNSYSNAAGSYFLRRKTSLIYIGKMVKMGIQAGGFDYTYTSHIIDTCNFYVFSNTGCPYYSLRPNCKLFQLSWRVKISQIWSNLYNKVLLFIIQISIIRFFINYNFIIYLFVGAINLCNLFDNFDQT